jgi:hypothetical protein
LSLTVEDKVSDIEGAGMQYLDPKKVKLFRAGDALRVTIEGDRSCLRVVPVRAFPLSLRDRYVRLQDVGGNELGMIRDPRELDRDSRKLLEAELRRRYFTPTILQIHSLREKMGIVEWKVKTDRGTTIFMTKSVHSSLTESGAGYVVTDVEGSRYEIRSVADLDPHSAAILGRWL